MTAHSDLNVLIGYGYHPTTTATYLQRALERRTRATTFVGTSYGARAGYAATGDIARLCAGLPDYPSLYLHIDSGHQFYFPRGLTNLTCPTACYLIDVHVQPKTHWKQAMFFDYAFSAQRTFVDVLRHLGHPRAYWLPLACDPEIHRRHDVPKRFDIGFVGSTSSHYARRAALLRRLEERFTLSDYKRSYTPEEMARVYSESHLVFNCSLRREVNMRVFEGPATGSLLLTDRIGNGLAELMADRTHLVMYDDAILVELAEEYLRDHAARERIAASVYEHVRAHHTYDHRAAQILDTIFAGSGPHLEAPLRRAGDSDLALAYAELYSRMGYVDDTITQFKALPATLGCRVPGAKQVALSLIRRVRYG